MIRMNVKSDWHIPRTIEEVDKVNKDCEARSGKVVNDEAKATVVVRSGELKDSIEHEGGIITALADHAKFVELGTHKMRAQPFLRPALINMKERILAIFKEGFK